MSNVIVGFVRFQNNLDCSSELSYVVTPVSATNIHMHIHLATTRICEVQHMYFVQCCTCTCITNNE